MGSGLHHGWNRMRLVFTGCLHLVVILVCRLLGHQRSDFSQLSALRRLDVRARPSFPLTARLLEGWARHWRRRHRRESDRGVGPPRKKHVLLYKTGSDSAVLRTDSFSEVKDVNRRGGMQINAILNQEGIRVSRPVLDRLLPWVSTPK